MPDVDQSIEDAYQELVDAMPPAEKIARCEAMFRLVCDQIGRQIRKEHEAISAERLKWLVALRLYSNNPIVRELILRKLEHVPG